MAWTPKELDYFKDHQLVFESRDLDKIISTVDGSVVGKELSKAEAMKILFFTAMTVNPKSICLIVENRGSSRSVNRAKYGQKILRIHYGIECKVEPKGEESCIVSIPSKGIKVFEFTFFKGTLRPSQLKPLMYAPLKKENTRYFGKPFDSLVNDLIDKVDWDSI